MKRLIKFLKTTLVGGLLFLVPIVALVIILGKALALAHKFMDPLTTYLPPEGVFGLHLPMLLAIGVLVLFCFLAGFFARTKLAQKLNQGVETAVLSKVPGYELMKSVSNSMLGVEKQGSYPVVLVRFDDTLQLGLQTGTFDHGLVSVFIPDSPNPQSGAVHFMTADRIKPAGIPLSAALKILQQYGAGAGALPRDLVLETPPAK